jgi:hypothetical protein
MAASIAALVAWYGFAAAIAIAEYVVSRPDALATISNQAQNLTFAPGELGFAYEAEGLTVYADVGVSGTSLTLSNFAIEGPPGCNWVLQASHGTSAGRGIAGLHQPQDRWRTAHRRQPRGDH